MSRRLIPLVAALGLLAGLSGCDKLQAALEEAPAAGPAPQSEKRTPPADKDKAQGTDAENGKAGARSTTVPVATHEPDDEYAVPFAWESSTEEPLGRARTFLKEAFADNADYMRRHATLFRTYADEQTPRATVLTCADSRVHTAAFDDTPENDDFVVRNVGNQVETTLGSVSYGVLQLRTPVLLVLGHTGCGAVKAAMDGASKLEEPLKKEIATLHPKKAAKGSRDPWLDAVVENVHDQVAVALAHFGHRVHAGKLTVVGVVYDFRNDLKQGAGRLVLVDVNGNRDAKRLEAFAQALKYQGAASERTEGAERDPEDGTTTLEEAHKALLQALATVPAARAAPGTPESAEHAPEPPHERHE